MEAAKIRGVRRCDAPLAGSERCTWKGAESHDGEGCSSMAESSTVRRRVSLDLDIGLRGGFRTEKEVDYSQPEVVLDGGVRSS